MIPIAVIAFREFFEAFLIIGILLGISRRLEIRREKEIILAAILGLVSAILLTIAAFFFGGTIRDAIAEDVMEILEGYLKIFSGFFIAYVVISLHALFHSGKHNIIKSVESGINNNAFDLSLFFTVVFLIVREGLEIALFSASTALFSTFFFNVIGLVTGFIAASFIGILTFFSYLKLSVRKLFRITESMIILLGASLVQSGVTELLEEKANFRLSEILPFPLMFLPSDDSFVGHFLKSFTGLDREFSLARLGIMLIYAVLIYRFILRRSSNKN